MANAAMSRTIRVKRKDFVQSKSSRLCAKHFTNEQFAINPLFGTSVEYKMKKLAAKPDAEPTVYDFETYRQRNRGGRKVKFSPIMWAEVPSDRCRTTNGCESFHHHFNDQFNSPHPAIFPFIDVINKIQCTAYIKMRPVDSVGLLPKYEQERLDHLVKQTLKLRNSEITRFENVKSIAFKFRTTADL
jgi:hypothetical protein